MNFPTANKGALFEDLTIAGSLPKMYIEKAKQIAEELMINEYVDPLILKLMRHRMKPLCARIAYISH